MPKVRLATVGLAAAAILAATGPARASIARVQRATGQNNGADTTLTAKWGSATTAGDLLVAVVAVRGGSDTTITPPAGLAWPSTPAIRSDNGTQVSVAIYYIANAASQSSTTQT